jgi:hypothetical protein
MLAEMNAFVGENRGVKTLLLSKIKGEQQKEILCNINIWKRQEKINNKL